METIKEKDNCYYRNSISDSIVLWCILYACISEFRLLYSNR